MLVFCFFAAVFSSVSWLIYSLMFVYGKLAEESLFSQDINLMLTYTSVVFLPIFVIWAVFGYINRFLSDRSLNRKQSELLNQLQKNQDYTDLVVRVMLDAEHEIKDGFVLNKFDVFINDMNEALSEVIQRCNIASSSQLEQLWQRVRRGEKWALGKAVVEAGKNQSTFNAWVKEKVERDKVFRGSLLEFCSRYQNLLQLLEKHDRDRVFLNMIEAGVFGKVYSLFAPLCENIQEKFIIPENHQPARPEVQKTNDYTSALKLATMEEPKADETIVHVDLNDEEREEAYADNKQSRGSFFSRLNIFQKNRESEDFVTESVDDPFFKALHNSFQGDDGVKEPEEPSFSATSISQETFLSSEPSPTFGKLQDTLNSLKVSHDEFETSEPVYKENSTEELSLKSEPSLSVQAQPMKKQDEDEDLVYPFGGWTDEENYRQ